jgi:flagellin-specific chaperone FliS
MKKSKKVETTTQTNSFVDSTYSLAKALHFIDLARQYFEDVQLGTNRDVKTIFSQYINKCNWIIFDLKNRLSQENRENLAKELEQSLDINAIMDKVIHLDNKQKAFIEDIIDAMRKGEEVIIVDDKK